MADTEKPEAKLIPVTSTGQVSADAEKSSTTENVNSQASDSTQNTLQSADSAVGSNDPTEVESLRVDASGGSEGELQETASQPGETDEGVEEEEGDNSEDDKKVTELRKTWGFRQSTLAQRDGTNGGESLSDSQDERPVTRGCNSAPAQPMPRRSGRSTKRSPHVQAFLAPKSRSKKSSGSPGNSGSSSPMSSRSTAGSPVKESKDKMDLSSDSKGSSSKSDKDSQASENKEAENVRTEMSINKVCGDKVARIELTPLRNTVLNKEEDPASKHMPGSSEDDLSLKELQERLRKTKFEQQQMEALAGSVGETSNVTSGKTPPVTDDGPIDVKHQNTSEKEGLPKVAAEDAQANEDKNQSLDCTDNLLDHDYAFQKRTGCICGKITFDRVQVLCKQCEGWIHGSCVGLTVELALEWEKDNKVYLCPRCCPVDSDEEEPHLKGLAQSAKPKSKGESQDSKTYMGKLEQETEPSDPKRPRIKIQQEEPAKEPEPAAKEPQPAAKEPQPAAKEPEPAANLPEPADKQSEPTTTTESERSAKDSLPTEKDTQPPPKEPEATAASQKCAVVECSNNALSGSVYCSNECIVKHAASTLQSMRKDGDKQKDKKDKETAKGKGKAKDKKKKKKKKGLLEKSRDQSPAAHGKSPKSKLRSAKDDKGAAQKSKAGMLKKSVEAASKDSKQTKESIPTDKGKGNTQPSVTKAGSEDRSQEHSAAAKVPVKPVTKQETVKPFVKGEGKFNVRSDNAKQLVKPIVKQDTTKSLIKQDISKPGIKFEMSKTGVRPVVKQEMAKTVVKQESSKTILKYQIGKTLFRQDKPFSGTQGVKMEKPSAASTSPKTEKAAIAPASSSHPVSRDKMLHKETAGSSGNLPATSHQKNHPSVEQIRQNVRRTLKDILAKRCSDSDDLSVAEEELVKVAGRIEKELFLLFQATDSRYKSKVRGLILNLKDPKNQGLFRRVLLGDMTPTRLVRLSPEELASRELALWRERDSSKMMKRESWESERRHRHKVEVDMEESPPHPDSEEADETVPEGYKAETAKADIMSCMLTDTTDQHKAHLFDLNCKICTGRMPPPPSEEFPAKKVKFSLPTSSSASPTSASKKPDSTSDRPTSQPLAEPTPIADVSSPVATTSIQVSTQAMQDSPEEPSESVSVAVPPAAVSGAVPPAAVSGGTPELVLASPTLAAFTAVPLPASAAEVITEESSASPEPVKPPPIISVPVVSQEIEPQNNARVDSLWKGFINMHGVAKVVTKAYPVSGSMAYVAEELPDTIHVGGRILAKMVWDYVGKLKSSATKEVCIIRFHPATEEEAVAYISLYSYFNSRKRYGVVDNASKSLKDMYLIPLAAQDPIPHQLLPFDGPGLEPSRSHMLLGLVIKQKSKRRHQGDCSDAGAEYEKSSRNSPEEKKGKYSYDGGESSSYSQRKESKKHRHKYEDANVSTTPPDFPPPPPPPTPPVAQSNILSKLFADKAAERPAASTSQPMMKPLEHILKTLFGNKELPKEAPKDPEKEKMNLLFPVSGLSGLPFSAKAGNFDSIIQQFSGAADASKVGDDRPYDPEDAYDPEDETIFEEKKSVAETTPYITLESLIPGLNPESLFNSGEIQKHVPGEQDLAPKVKEPVVPQSYLMASRDPRQAANRNQSASSIPLPVFQIQEPVKPVAEKPSELSNIEVKSVVETKPQEIPVVFNAPAKEADAPDALPIPPAVSLEVTDKVDTPVEEFSTPEGLEVTAAVPEPKATEESSPSVEDKIVENEDGLEATDKEMTTAEVPQETESTVNKDDKVQEETISVDESPEKNTEEMSLEAADDKEEVIEDDGEDLYDIEQPTVSSDKEESAVEDADSMSSNEEENKTPESENAEQKMDTQSIPPFISDAPQNIQSISTFHRAVPSKQSDSEDDLGLSSCDPEVSMTESLYKKENSSHNMPLVDRHPSSLFIPISDVSRDAPPPPPPPPVSLVGPPPTIHGQQHSVPPPLHLLRPPPSGIPHNVPPPGHPLGPPPGHMGLPPHGPPPSHAIVPPPNMIGHPPNMPPHLGPPPGHVGPPPLGPPPGPLLGLPPFSRQGPPTQQGPPNSHPLGPPPGHLSGQPSRAPPLGQLGNLPPVHGQQHGLPVGHHLGPPPSHMGIRPPGPPHSAPYGMPPPGAPPPGAPPPGGLPPQHFNMLPPAPPVQGHVGVPPAHICGPPPGHAGNALPVRGPPPGHIGGPPPRFPCGPPQEQGPPKMPDNQPLHMPRSGASSGPPPGFGSGPVSTHHGPMESRNTPPLDAPPWGSDYSRGPPHGQGLPGAHAQTKEGPPENPHDRGSRQHREYSSQPGPGPRPQQPMGFHPQRALLPTPLIRPNDGLRPRFPGGDHQAPGFPRPLLQNPPGQMPSGFQPIHQHDKPGQPFTQGPLLQPNLQGPHNRRPPNFAEQFKDPDNQGSRNTDVEAVAPHSQDRMLEKHVDEPWTRPEETQEHFPSETFPREDEEAAQWEKGSPGQWERPRGERDWDRNKERYRERDQEVEHGRDRDWERGKERDRSRHGRSSRHHREGKGRHRSRSRSRERDRHREHGRERDRDRGRDKERDEELVVGKDRVPEVDNSKAAEGVPKEEPEKDAEPENEPEKEREKPHERDRGRDRDYHEREYYDRERDHHERDRNRERDKARHRDRARERSRSKVRDRRRDRSRSRERNRGDRSRSRDKGRRDKSRSRERDKVRDRDRDRSRTRERDRHRGRDRSRSRERERDRERRSRSRERRRDRERDYSRSRSRERDRDGGRVKESGGSKESEGTKAQDKGKSREKENAEES